MLSVMVWLLSSLFGAWQLTEPSIQSSRTSDLSNGSCRMRPPIPVESVYPASSASCKHSPCGAVPCWRLCPSPSQVHHCHSACQAQYLLHHHPRLPHHPHLRNLQDRSDCLRYYSTSSRMLIQALWLSIVTIQHSSYVPALAESLSLRHELAFLPLRSLYPHNPQFFSLFLDCLKHAFPIVSLPKVSF